MKAQKIFENIDFRRTKDSKKYLGVGKQIPKKIGDIFDFTNHGGSFLAITPLEYWVPINISEFER